VSDAIEQKAEVTAAQAMTPADPTTYNRLRARLVWALPLLLLALLVAFRQVMLPFVLGILVAYLLAPLVGGVAQIRIGKRRVPRGAGVIVVYLGIAAAIALFLLEFLPRVSGDFAHLLRETPTFLRRVRLEYLPRADAWLEERFEPRREEGPAHPHKLIVTQRSPGSYEIDLEQLQLEIDPVGKGRYVIAPRDDSDEPKGRLSDLLAQLTRSTENELRGVVETGQRVVRGVVRSLAWFVLTFMVAAYLLVDVQRVLSFFRSLVPTERRSDFDELVTQVDRGLSGVIRGQLLICLVNGVLTSVGLVLFHVKYAVLLGLLAAMLSFIPVFGSIISSIPIVLVALGSGQDGVSMSTGLAVLLWIIGIHFLEANLFNPKIIGDAAKIHPVVVVFALLVGEESGGLAGAVIAVPTASILQALFVWSRKRQNAPAPSAMTAGQGT
jgi:predicted PurR-regulated permease PerM